MGGGGIKQFIFLIFMYIPCIFIVYFIVCINICTRMHMHTHTYTYTHTHITILNYSSGSFDIVFTDVIKY